MKPCGTPAAYARHRIKAETPCDLCREANRLRNHKDTWERSLSETVECGTVLGYYAHFSRENLPVCEACEEANKGYVRPSRPSKPQKTRRPIKCLNNDEVFFTSTSKVYDPDRAVVHRFHKAQKELKDTGRPTTCSLHPSSFDLVVPHYRSVEKVGEFLESARKLRRVCEACPLLTLCFEELKTDPHRTGFQAGRVIDPPRDLLSRGVGAQDEQQPVQS